MKVSIELQEGNKFEATARQHSLTLWQGDPTAREKSISSLELLLMSLGSCMMGTMLNFANNQGYEIRNASFSLTGNEAPHPTRISEIDIKAEIEADLTQKEIDRLIRAANHCKIHNTLMNIPAVNFKLAVNGRENEENG